MTAPVDYSAIYREAQAKRNRRDYYLSDKPKPAAPVYLSRSERNEVWVAQYESGLSTTEIAARWERERGEKCYPELVRRTLRVLGIAMRPRGWQSTNAKRSTLVARVALLERQLAALLQGKEAA